MNSFLTMLQGKKTHILVLIYVIVVLLGGGTSGEADILGGIDAGQLQQSLMALMVSTLKAAWDRRGGS